MIKIERKPLKFEELTIIQISGWELNHICKEGIYPEDHVFSLYNGILTDLNLNVSFDLNNGGKNEQ